MALACTLARQAVRSFIAPLTMRHRRKSSPSPGRALPFQVLGMTARRVKTIGWLRSCRCGPAGGRAPSAGCASRPGPGAGAVWAWELSSRQRELEAARRRVGGGVRPPGKMNGTCCVRSAAARSGSPPRSMRWRPAGSSQRQLLASNSHLTKRQVMGLVDCARRPCRCGGEVVCGRGLLSCRSTGRTRRSRARR